MYKLRIADELFCRLPGYSSRKTYSIWFYDKNPVILLRNFIIERSPCNPRLFPCVYWIVTVISIVGFLLSVWEFLTISKNNRIITTFRERQFRVLSYQFRRNCRLLGSVIMSFVNLLLFLGLIMISPMSMMPWLTIKGAIFLLELLLWACDVFKNNDAFSFLTVFSFLMFALSWCLTNCVRRIFDKAIEIDNIEAFQLFGNSDKNCF